MTLESPLDCKEIQPVLPEGEQSWVFIGGTDAEAETPIIWPPHVKSWLIGKDSDSGRDWGQEDDRGWDGWMASLIRWTWVWVNSGSWWWTGRPGVLRFMRSQTVRHDWVTELIWMGTFVAQETRSQIWLLVLLLTPTRREIREVYQHHHQIRCIGLWIRAASLIFSLSTLFALENQKSSTYEVDI